jgi:hypothetical protein
MIFFAFEVHQWETVLVVKPKGMNTRFFTCPAFCGNSLSRQFDTAAREDYKSKPHHFAAKGGGVVNTAKYYKAVAQKSISTKE